MKLSVGASPWKFDPAVKALVQALGPMRGAYTGPYPTRAEAVGAFESGAISVSADELAKGAWLTAGYQVRLSRVTLDAVRGERYQGPYKAALLDGVLLLQSDSARDLETVKRTVMIVPGNEEIIARYLAYPQ